MSLIRNATIKDIDKITEIKAKELYFKTLFAILMDCNLASRKLLEKFGFEQWGRIPEVADFNGVECGHYYYGMKI